MRLAPRLAAAAIALLLMNDTVRGDVERAKWLLSSGINMDWWFRTVNEPPALSREKIRNIAEAGFRHVRLPIGPSTLGFRYFKQGSHCRRDNGPLYRLIAEMRESLEENNVGLVLAPDANSDSSYFADTPQSEQSDQLEQLLTCIIETVRAVDRDFASRFVIFSASSEPRIDPKKWSRLQKEALDRIAAREPSLFFLATPAFPSRIWDLLNLAKSEFPNVGYEFHYYEPYLFTHQGVQSAFLYMRDKSEVVLGAEHRDCTAIQNSVSGGRSCVKCVTSSADVFCKEYFRQKVRAFGLDFVRNQFDYVSAWAEGKLVYVGEYGVNKGRREFWGARREDRIAWLRTVTTAAKSVGIGRAVYELGCGMGMTRSVTCDAVSFKRELQLDFDEDLVAAVR